MDMAKESVQEWKVGYSEDDVLGPEYGRRQQGHYVHANEWSID